MGDSRECYRLKVSNTPIVVLAFGQSCLLGLWAGIGRTRAAIRLPVVVFVMAVWGQIICILFGPQNSNPWNYQSSVVLDFSLIAGFFAVTFGMSRILGSTRLIFAAEPADTTAIATVERRFQFTISEMLQTVAGCGAVLSIIKLFYPPIEWFPVSALAVESAFVGLYVISGALAMWAVLHVDFRTWRLGVLAAATWISMVAAAVAQSDNPSLDRGANLCIWPYLTLVSGRGYSSAEFAAIG